MAEGCKAPNKPSAYFAFVKAEEREKRGLPEGACVCRSKTCRRKLGMEPPPQKPGRKRTIEEVFATVPTGRPVGESGGGLRAKPAIVVKIHSFKDGRCARAQPTRSPPSQKTCARGAQVRQGRFRARNARREHPRRAARSLALREVEVSRVRRAWQIQGTG